MDFRSARTDLTAQDGVEAQTRDKTAKPFVEQYVAVPPDFVQICRERNEFKQTLDAPARKSGLGSGQKVIGARHAWLLTTMYRMYRKEANRLYVDPHLLAAASGWGVEAIRRELRQGPMRQWAEFDLSSNDAYDYEAGENRWDIRLAPVDDRDFLKVPAWWLWQEPMPDAVYADRFARRSWRKGSPALLIALALLRITPFDTRSTDRYGVKALMTHTGLGRSSVERGLREAEEYGFLASMNRIGGKRKAVRTLRMLPSAPIGDISPNWFPGPWTTHPMERESTVRTESEPGLFPLAG